MKSTQEQIKQDAYRLRAQEHELRKAAALVQIIECTDRYANDSKNYSNLKNNAVDKLNDIVTSLD